MSRIPVNKERRYDSVLMATSRGKSLLSIAKFCQIMSTFLWFGGLEIRSYNTSSATRLASWLCAVDIAIGTVEIELE